MQTRTVEYKQGDQVLEGYIAWEDATAGPRPGVLVVHEWTGLGDYFKMRCRKLAKLGYVAFEAEMRAAGVDWQLVAYGGAVHAFTNPSAGSDTSRGAAYNATTDRRPWEAMRAFFEEIFKRG